jgi:hypothetical protein
MDWNLTLAFHISELTGDQLLVNDKLSVHGSSNFGVGISCTQMVTRKGLPTYVPKLVWIRIIYLDQFGYKKRFIYSCTRIGLNEIFFWKTQFHDYAS